MKSNFDVVRCSNCVSLFGPVNTIADVKVRFADWAKFLGLEVTLDKGYVLTATDSPLFPSDWQDDENANQPEGEPRGYEQWAKNTF